MCLLPYLLKILIILYQCEFRDTGQNCYFRFVFVICRYWLFFGKNMTENTSKRKLRIENKKKKMAALLDITKLNEYDRAQKNKHTLKLEPQEELPAVKPEVEPSPKRLKIGDTEASLQKY